MYAHKKRQLSALPAARGIAVAVAALALATFIPTARADSRVAELLSQLGDVEDLAYRKTIEDGLAEYDARHFEEARSLFRRAHTMSPNARTFRGIGMTSFELRDYVSAVHNLSSALRDVHKPLSTVQRKQTQELLDRSHLFVDVYTLTVSPQDAHVLVDGSAPEFESDGTLMLGFGQHTLEVRAPGMVARTLPIDVRGGESKNLSVTLESEAAAHTESPSPSAEAGSVATVTRPSPRMSNRGPAAWLWASGGAALVTVGAGIYWYNRASQLDSCNNPPLDSQCTNKSSLKTLQNVAIGTTIGVGAAALTMALIGILSWHSGPAAGQTQTALDCVIGPLGIACGRSF
jgi:hypothetical protein